MSGKELLRTVKQLLHDVHGGRLRGVVLYGSEARGDARPDSDIDILVLLDGPVHLWPDVQASVRALYPLVLQLGRPIHASPVALADYEADEFPLYRAARREGIAA